MTQAGKVDGARRTAPLRGTGLPSANAEAARLKAERDSASLSGTRGTRPLAEALEEAKQKNPLATFGNKVVDGSRELIASGYKYPPNLTTQYYHSPGKVGCCADFVADSYLEAGYDLGGDAKSKGYNPHYCPSMIKYFAKEQQLIDKASPAHVGDAVFFDWDKDGTSDHLAIVTKVDASGRPIEIMESNQFGQPAHSSPMDPRRLGSVMAYGRLTGAGADDGAAAQLGPITNPASGSGPAYSGRASAPRGTGYANPGPDGSVPSAPAPARTLAMQAALALLYETLSDAYGLKDEEVQSLIEAKRQGRDVRALAKEMGVPTLKLAQLDKEIGKAAEKAATLVGDNNLPLPRGDDGWGMDADQGQEIFARHRDAIEQAAKVAGVEPEALGAYLWLQDDFKLGDDPAATIRQAAADLKAAAKSGDLAGTALAALDPEGKMSPEDREATLQLFANRYAALKDKPESK
ncbi:MAG: CHAP domain-containing protein [Candidatus Sericytochromatia bacterium]|nr:CHAP domain-containing protein [Candidatus Tanganyikabacteria bacterium]